MWWGEEEGGVLVRGYVLGWGLGVPDDAARELPAHLHSHVIRGLGMCAAHTHIHCVRYGM